MTHKNLINFTIVTSSLAIKKTPLLYVRRPDKISLAYYSIFI